VNNGWRGLNIINGEKKTGEEISMRRENIWQRSGYERKQ